jgi:hypothetical protein
MKFIRKLFGLEKQPVVTPDAWGSKDVANESKAVSINEQPITPAATAPAITQVAQATKAVEILKAKEEFSAPAKVAPVKKSTPKKQPVKKAPAKK